MTKPKKKTYKIQLSVAIFKDKKLSYKNEMLVPTSYTRRSEARAHIKKEIRERLKHSSFFISPRLDYDLVRYSNEATCNTYLRYRIIEEPGLPKVSEEPGAIKKYSLQVPRNEAQREA